MGDGHPRDRTKYQQKACTAWPRPNQHQHAGTGHAPCCTARRLPSSPPPPCNAPPGGPRGPGSSPKPRSAAAPAHPGALAAPWCRCCHSAAMEASPRHCRAATPRPRPTPGRCARSQPRASRCAASSRPGSVFQPKRMCAPRARCAGPRAPLRGLSGDPAAQRCLTCCRAAARGFWDNPGPATAGWLGLTREAQRQW